MPSERPPLETTTWTGSGPFLRVQQLDALVTVSSEEAVEYCARQGSPISPPQTFRLVHQLRLGLRTGGSMGVRDVAVVALVVASVGLSSCSGEHSPTAPGNGSVPTAPAPAPIVRLASSGIGEIGQNSQGEWVYTATTFVGNEGAGDVTLTGYDVQVTLNSTIVATASTASDVVVPAHSRRSIAIEFTSATRLNVVTLGSAVRVAYKDAYGSTGVASATFCCFGTWDY